MQNRSLTIIWDSSEKTTLCDCSMLTKPQYHINGDTMVQGEVYKKIRKIEGKITKESGISLDSCFRSFFLFRAYYDGDHNTTCSSYFSQLGFE